MHTDTTTPGAEAAGPPADDRLLQELQDRALASLDGAPDPRTRELLRGVVRHLHALVRDVRPTLPEWERAVAFLTAAGQKSDDTRQEFVLLSDVLGVSMAVETLNSAPEGTHSTVLGPFHMTESPRRELGDSIDLVGGSTPCVVSGRVTGTDGTPVPGATVDVWQCDAEGFYDVQRPDTQPAGNGRGLFTTDGEGRYRFRTVVPSHYPIPTDGPGGELLAASGRHPYRPAHVHVIASAPGYRTLTTHAFVAGSPYVDDDTVFAARPELVVEFAESDDAEQARRYGVPVPFRHARFDISLAPA